MSARQRPTRTCDGASCAILGAITCLCYVRIATSTRVTFGIVLGAVVGIGVVWRVDRSQPQPEQPSTLIDVARPPLDLVLEPSSSSVQHEPPPPPAAPFYASLFVEGATWTLPCAFGVLAEPHDTQRCHVDSVNVTAGETRARIACWFVHEPDVRDPDPAINTYVMTAKGLYIGDATGEPIFTPHPIPKSLPKRWGLEEPSYPDGDDADGMVRHDGAWCRIYEHQSLDFSFGHTQCISRHGIVGLSDREMFSTHRCGSVP